jgi:hypothetical protein
MVRNSAYSSTGGRIGLTEWNHNAVGVHPHSRRVHKDTCTLWAPYTVCDITKMNNVCVRHTNGLSLQALQKAIKEK